MSKAKNKNEPEEKIEKVEKIEITCKKNYNCFKNNEKCPNSPCILNKDKFGLHEKIIDTFLEAEEFDEAYYYFQDLLVLFNFNCSIEEFDKINQEFHNKKIDTKNYPLGCRIFIYSREMKDFKKNIKKLKEYDGKNVCKTTIDSLANNKKDFIKTMYHSLDILKHLAMAKRNEMEDQKFYLDKGMAFLDKSILAKDKYNIETKQSDIVEQAIDRAKELAGFDKKTQDFNRDRLKKADIIDKKDKLMKLLQENIIKSNGEITPEIQKLIDEIKELEDK